MSGKLKKILKIELRDDTSIGSHCNKIVNKVSNLQNKPVILKVQYVITINITTVIYLLVNSSYVCKSCVDNVTKSCHWKAFGGTIQDIKIVCSLLFQINCVVTNE